MKPAQKSNESSSSFRRLGEVLVRRDIPVLSSLPKDPDLARAKLFQSIAAAHAGGQTHPNVAVAEKHVDLDALGFTSTRMALPFKHEGLFPQTWRAGELHAHKIPGYYLVHRDAHGVEDLRERVIHDALPAIRQILRGEQQELVKKANLFGLAMGPIGHFATNIAGRAAHHGSNLGEVMAHKGFQHGAGGASIAPGALRSVSSLMGAESTATYQAAHALGKHLYGLPPAERQAAIAAIQAGGASAHPAVQHLQHSPVLGDLLRAVNHDAAGTAPTPQATGLLAKGYSGLVRAMSRPTTHEFDAPGRTLVQNAVGIAPLAAFHGVDAAATGAVPIGAMAHVGVNAIREGLGKSSIGKKFVHQSFQQGAEGVPMSKAKELAFDIGGSPAVLDPYRMGRAAHEAGVGAPVASAMKNWDGTPQQLLQQAPAIAAHAATRGGVHMTPEQVQALAQKHLPAISAQVQKEAPSLHSRIMNAITPYLAKTAELAEDGEHQLQGRINFQGLDIAVENRKGSVRSGTSPNGKTWCTKMVAPYGYIEGTKGKDGDSLDAYVGPNKDATDAYVVHQHKPDGTGFDEDKVMLGCSSKEEATELYLAHYNSPKFLGPISKIPMEKLKEILAKKDHVGKLTAKTAQLLKRSSEDEAVPLRDRALYPAGAGAGVGLTGYATYRALAPAFSAGPDVAVLQAPTVETAEGAPRVGDLLFSNERVSAHPIRGRMNRLLNVVQGGSPIQHVSMYVGNGDVVYATNNGGVLRESMKDLVHHNDVVVSRVDATASERQRAASFVEKAVGKDYSYRDLARMVIPKLIDKAKATKTIQQQDGYTCSGLIAAAYKGKEFVDKAPNAVTPYDLYRSKLVGKAQPLEMPAKTAGTKLALTRAAQEYMKAQGAGDLGTMRTIQQGYTQAGLPMRSGAPVNEGGLEQAVRTGFGTLQQRPGQELHTVPGLQAPEYGWAEKLVKRDSPIATGQGAVELAKQRMAVTQQAQQMGGKAQQYLAPTHAARVMHGADGSMGMATYQDYYPNAKTVGGVGRGGDVAGARQMVADVHQGLVQPLQQQGTQLRDIASLHEGRVVGNKGSIIQTPQGPKLIDHIPAMQGRASPVSTLETPTGSQVLSTNGRSDTTWYPQNKQQMNQLAKSNYAPTAQNAMAPVRPTAAPAPLPSLRPGVSSAATQAAPGALDRTVAAMPKRLPTPTPRMPATAVTAMLPKPNLPKLTSAISKVTKVL